MKDKKGLILGLANERSIAWGIAKACREAGASLAFTYQGAALGKRVEPLAKSLDSEIVLPCDVSDEISVNNVFSEIEKKWGHLDFIVHAIGFSDKNELRGRYLDTSEQNFINTMQISVFSFTSSGIGIFRLNLPTFIIF